MKQVEVKPEFSGIHKKRERTTNFVFIPVNNFFQNTILETKLDSSLIDLGRRNCISTMKYRIGAILHGNCRCTVAEGGSKFLQSVPKP